MKPSLLTLALISSAFLVSSASAQYATDFEAPTFTSGTIHGQDTWTSSTPDRARILTGSEIAAAVTDLGMTPGVTVHSGSQALLVSGTGGSSATVRVIGGLEVETSVTLEVWAAPLMGTTNPISNMFVTMENITGGRAAAFRFGPAQSLDVGTDVTGIWQPTGLKWEPGKWYRLTMRADYATKTYDFSVDGVQVNTSPIPFYNPAVQNFGQIRIFRGSNQSGAIFDDLSVSASGPRRDIFWSETGGFDGPNLGAIYSAGFDGSDKVAIATGLNRPIGVTLDPKKRPHLLGGRRFCSEPQPHCPREPGWLQPHNSFHWAQDGRSSG
jgi:hypothetical protein